MPPRKHDTWRGGWGAFQFTGQVFSTRSQAQLGNEKKWGQTLKEPRQGCIVVFPGHVGLYFGDYNKENISLLGGNQGDAVNITPFSKKGIVCRWPS